MVLGGSPSGVAPRPKVYSEVRPRFPTSHRDLCALVGHAAEWLISATGRHLIHGQTVGNPQTGQGGSRHPPGLTTQCQRDRLSTANVFKFLLDCLDPVGSRCHGFVEDFRTEFTTLELVRGIGPRRCSAVYAAFCVFAAIRIQ